MKRILVFAAALLFVGLVRVGLAEPQDQERPKDLAALERKLIGSWKGEIGCAGNFLFRADGTYALTGYGPGADDSAGTWTVRWHALPPTLVLRCTSSEVPGEAGKSMEMKLLELDDRNLLVKHANPDADRYARVKK